DPRGLRLNWTAASLEAKVRWLDDDRPAVRDRALASVARCGDTAIPELGKALAPPAGPRLRTNAVWALTRIGTPPARTQLCRAAASDPGVRQAAVHGLGALREPAARTRLARIVVDDEPALRREAATALGLIGNPAGVRPLLESLRTCRDEFLEHALIYALIEIN